MSELLNTKPFPPTRNDALCRLLAGESEPLWATWGPEKSTHWVQAAEGEGVAPLLYWHYQSIGWPAEMPFPVREALTRIYYNTVAYNTMRLQELIKVLAIFAEAKIPVLVLKGAALVDSYYDDLGLRPMGDMDVLIPQAKLEMAFEIVRGLGYSPADVEIFSGIRREVWHHESWRGGAGKQIGLELHWQLIAGPADDRNVSVDWFWAHAETLPGRSQFLRGHFIPQMHPTAHLLYLAAHLSLRHGGNQERLIWFYDADQLVRSGRVDWKTFIQQAHILGWGAPARYILEGASHRFGTILPKILSQLSDGTAWDTFLSERETKTGRISRTVETWQRVRHLKRSIQVRWLFALFFPQRAYLHWRYQPNPSWLWPFYYVFRWWDIARDWALGMVLAWKKKRV